MASARGAISRSHASRTRARSALSSGERSSSIATILPRGTHGLADARRAPRRHRALGLRLEREEGSARSLAGDVRDEEGLPGPRDQARRSPGARRRAAHDRAPLDQERDEPVARHPPDRGRAARHARRLEALHRPHERARSRRARRDAGGHASGQAERLPARGLALGHEHEGERRHLGAHRALQLPDREPRDEGDRGRVALRLPRGPAVRRALAVGVLSALLAACATGETRPLRDSEVRSAGAELAKTLEKVSVPGQPTLRIVADGPEALVEEARRRAIECGKFTVSETEKNPAFALENDVSEEREASGPVLHVTFSLIER